MTVADVAETKEPKPPRGRNPWNWHPEFPLPRSPIAGRPLRPFGLLIDIIKSWVPVSEKLILVGITFVVWFYLTPSMERMQEFAFDWIAEIYIRNLALFSLIAGGLHLYLYTFKRQGNTYQYDLKPFQEKNTRFTFNNQVYDNMFWSLASGVTCLTVYEVVALWAYANGFMPYLSWEDNPVWFVLLFLLIPLWNNFHFYWIHRMIHWQPLYKTVHYLHHRNTNVGPWSGFSMHPVEHVIYLSSALIHLIVVSHPLHFLFNLHSKALFGPTSHAGFEKLIARPGGKHGLHIGDFFHQLHHKYFECNFGEPLVPFDEWFGTYHDGTPEALARMREEMKKRGVTRN